MLNYDLCIVINTNSKISNFQKWYLLLLIGLKIFKGNHNDKYVNKAYNVLFFSFLFSFLKSRIEI